LKKIRKEITNIFLVSLTAQNGDLTKSYENLKNFIIWRRQYNIDQLTDWTPSSNYSVDCPLKFVGLNHTNLAVVIIHFGKWKLREISCRGYQEMFMEYFNCVFEKLMSGMEAKRSAWKGWPGSQFVGLWDLQGFSDMTLSCPSGISI